jgi:hypothetical protein
MNNKFNNMLQEFLKNNNVENIVKQMKNYKNF